MTDRSLTTRAFDGFWAPRWCHHVVKLATGGLVLGVFALLASSPAHAAICSLLWFGTIRVAYAIDHGTPLLKPDLWCDLALHVLPLAVMLRDWRLAAPAIACCVGAYWWSYPEATP